MLYWFVSVLSVNLGRVAPVSATKTFQYLENNKENERQRLTLTTTALPRQLSIDEKHLSLPVSCVGVQSVVMLTVLWRLASNLAQYRHLSINWRGDPGGR